MLFSWNTRTLLVNIIVINNTRYSNLIVYRYTLVRMNDVIIVLIILFPYFILNVYINKHLNQKSF